MRRVLTALAALSAATAGFTGQQHAVAAAGPPQGHDVASHQRDADRAKARAAGAGFVYVKATESITYRNPYFGAQYDGAGAVGLPRGAHHLALPDKGSGLSRAGMAAWIRTFSDEVLRPTGRRPVIYTTTHWWSTCTGGSRGLAAGHALRLPGDQNLFNGSAEQPAEFAATPEEKPDTVTPI